MKSLDTLVNIFLKYADHIEELRKENSAHFNGCKGRAEAMAQEMRDAGYTPQIIIVKSFSTLTHESGAWWGHNYHTVVLCDGNIFDPNYTRKKPIPLEEYASLYSEKEDIVLWKKGDTSKPLWYSSARASKFSSPCS